MAELTSISFDPVHVRPECPPPPRRWPLAQARAKVLCGLAQPRDFSRALAWPWLPRLLRWLSNVRCPSELPRFRSAEPCCSRCPPSPIISVRSWEFGNWELGKKDSVAELSIRYHRHQAPPPHLSEPLPPGSSPRSDFLSRATREVPRATKTTNPDARRLALREELTFPSSSLASVAGSSEPGLLLSSTSDRRQRPRSTPTSLRVAPRIVLGTLHRTTAPFRKGRRRSFNLNLNHNHHIHLAQVHEPP